MPREFAFRNPNQSLIELARCYCYVSQAQFQCQVSFRKFRCLLVLALVFRNLLTCCCFYKLLYCSLDQLPTAIERVVDQQQYTHYPPSFHLLVFTNQQDSRQNQLASSILKARKTSLIQVGQSLMIRSQILTLTQKRNHQYHS